MARLFNAIPKRVPPAVPAGTRIYAIGDIHGRADLLHRLLALIDADNRALSRADVCVIYLGDYIDRGPDSRDVVSLVKAPHAMADRVVRLRGNHEETLLRFLDDPRHGHEWLQDYGGAATLLSYGVRVPPDLSPVERLEFMADELGRRLGDHRLFFETLAVSETVGDYFFVHAGVDPSLPLSEQRASTLTTIRDPFLDWGRPLEKVVVHGHSIAHIAELQDWRIGIDTGAYATGHLSCLVLERDEQRILCT